MDENIEVAGKTFSDLAAFGEDLGVRIMFENCPMVGWQSDGMVGSIAYAPSIWDKLFSAVRSDNFGLNLDPSHLVWQQIDYNGIMEDFADKIYHCHAKDTEIIEEKLARNGIYGSDWWLPKIPGDGQIDWIKFVDSLRGIGYDGAMSIELEDAAWEKDEASVKKGLVRAAEHLRPWLGGG